MTGVRRERPKVYGVRDGGRFHRYPHCEGLNTAGDRVPAITRREAARRRMTPCLICKPGPLLEVAR